MIIRISIVLVVFLGMAQQLSSQNLVDKDATIATKSLYHTLRESGLKGFLFGHQDDLSYGIGWKYRTGTHRSDVKEVCGDYPALFGWDLGHIEVDSTQNLDSVRFDEIRQNIIYAHSIGALNTISWHSNNPVTGGSSWDTIRAVSHILPGGDKYEFYKGYLKRVGRFLASLKDAKGQAIPIIFRPYHEHNGSWFWWGEKSCTVQEYTGLWRHSVAFWRDSMGLHNLIYAYSPNLYQSEEEYLHKYPGDAWVDVLGLDIYDLPEYNIDYVKELPKNIHILSDLARKKNKVYALTETGYHKVPRGDWWTESLLKNIEHSGIAWVLVWRNAHKESFFVPYPGQMSEANFIKFYESPKTLFLRELKKAK